MPQATDIPMVKLNNGVEMPQFGLGVWQAEAGQEVEQAILTALKAGYRLIDTAKIYGNEESVGKAIRKSGVPRQEIFVTTKLWNSDQGHDSALAAFDASLERLGLDYVDLYLIHWPVPSQDKYVETWAALEKIYGDKRARAIGVSNFKPAHLEKLLANCQTIPAINQIELHPHMQQLETRQFCSQHNIQVESYSPIKQGGDVLEDPAIAELAKHYDKTAAQIVLRWHIQEGLVVIPKSVTPERIESNVDIFDFALNDDDMERIRQLNRDERVAPDPDNLA
jgi:2,5-diketo-D-gluconate reductase A